MGNASDQLIKEVPLEYLARFIQYLYSDAGYYDSNPRTLTENQHGAIELSKELHKKIEEKLDIKIGAPNSQELQNLIDLHSGRRKGSLGVIRVRLDFNPSERPEVRMIKEKVAALIDICEEYKPQDIRLAALAQTAFEEGAMWAVKAATSTP